MLKYAHSYCVLAEELHFSRAAARLHLTQPALSHQIRKLEEQIGCTLLHRSPQKVTLTEAGIILAHELSAALHQVSRAVEQAQDAARGDAGALAVGYCELPEAGRLSAIIRRFSVEYPGVEITLKKLPTNAQALALAAGSLDVAFLHPPLLNLSLTLRPAGEEWIVAALPVFHPLLDKPTLRLADLESERLITCAEETGSFMYHDILAACGRVGFQPRLRQERESWLAMLDQVVCGLGIALVPESLSRGPHTQLLFRPIMDLDVKLRTAIATNGEPTRPAVARFIATAMSLQQDDG